MSSTPPIASVELLLDLVDQSDEHTLRSAPPSDFIEDLQSTWQEKPTRARRIAQGIYLLDLAESQEMPSPELFNELPSRMSNELSEVVMADICKIRGGIGERWTGTAGEIAVQRAELYASKVLTDLSSRGVREAITKQPEAGDRLVRQRLRLEQAQQNAGELVSQETGGDSLNVSDTYSTVQLKLMLGALASEQQERETGSSYAPSPTSKLLLKVRSAATGVTSYYKPSRR